MSYADGLEARTSLCGAEEGRVPRPSTELKEHEKRSPEPLDEDMYGLGIASLVRDCERLFAGTEHAKTRVVRFSVSILVLVFVIALQIYLLVEIKLFVSAPAVQKARTVYDKFEWTMYGSDESHMVLTSNHKHRGLPEFFDPTLFDKMSKPDKETACSISLSQPTYFLTVIFIWTLTCIADIQRSYNLLLRFIWATPTISSMKYATEVSEDDDKQLIIVGLTQPLKFVIAAVFLIRMAVTCVLLWLGCRWLTATPSFSDILLNAVALEFVLMLKDLLFVSIVPPRSRRETANTLVLPLNPSDPPSYKVLVIPFIWGFLAVAWVGLYAYVFQQVLPDYRWDVAVVCNSWLAERLADGGEGRQ